MEHKTLAIKEREKINKGANNRLRKDGLIPAVVYGHQAPVSITVDAKEFNKKFYTVSENTLINLETGKKTYEVLVKDYQEDILTGKITHIDFYEVEKGKLLKTKVPIHVKGIAIGVKEGGILEHLLHEMEVECLPKDIPADILVDITELALHHSIHVRDIPTEEGVRFLNAPDQVIVLVTHKKAEVVEEEEVEEGLEEGEEAASAEEASTEEE
jgi:large subunit ribosomal protein L25